MISAQKELSRLNDMTLVQAFMDGNDKCFNVLLARYKSKIFTTIYLIVKDRDIAEDLFQDVMMKIVRMIRAGKYNDEGKFLPWAARIARNLAIDYFRKNQRAPFQRETEDYETLAKLGKSEGGAEENIIKDENARYLRVLIQQLPDKQREVLVMRSYADLSFKEIAELTNVSINTALGRMRYALINLKKLADDAGFTQKYQDYFLD
jgi:RNA polymerase sigma factor (sigma-70 family)